MAQQAGAAESKAAWKELLQDGRAVYTVLLNLGVALHATNIFIVSTVMPSVVADIGGISLYAWPAMLYMVGSITGAACGGSLLGALGRRDAYVLAGVVFGAGAAGCAMAPTMWMLIAGQLVQGFGGGLLQSLSMALVSGIYEGRLRTRVLSLISTTWSVAALIGPPLAGVFADIGWGRGAFWFNIAGVAAFIVVAWRVLPRSREGRAVSGWPFLRLGLLAAAVICVGLSGQLRLAPTTVALLAASAVLVWLAFRLDPRSDRRLFPSHAMSLFSPVGTAYWVFFLVSFTHVSISMFMPLLLQVVHGVAPLWVGYITMVFSFAWTVGSVLVSGWSGGWARVAMVGGMAMCAVGVAALAVDAATASIWLLGLYVMVVGVGIGMANVHTTAWGMAAAIDGEQTITASAIPVIRSLGIAFGSAAAGLIANAAGLGDGTGREEVAAALSWVYALNVAPPLLAIAFMASMLALKTRIDKAG